jgi:hypothetical protein
MTLILIMVSVPFIAGFALGWGLRSLLSYHRREKARRYGHVPVRPSAQPAKGAPGG